MQSDPRAHDGQTGAARAFYQRALATLRDAKVPFLVCGSHALEAYTGIGRLVKDLDVFVRKVDCDRALQALQDAGYRTELVFPHWLAKAYNGKIFLDVIFSSGNGQCPVDDTWFAPAPDAEVFGTPVKLCPPEEMIWQQAFVMERERYDGADVAHLFLALAGRLDWQRLLARFGPNWRVLLAHLVLFGFIYPSHRGSIPEWVMRELIGRLEAEMGPGGSNEAVCRGTLLSRAQYLVDVERRGFQDARLIPEGNMTRDDVSRWTAPIPQEMREREK
ncbi:MAG TPA: nucleotidyltransferase family protein [Gemmataceae bacterium]|nr:nucleotidyltransferase family protein [Gemmataceae bacterium]